ncbi:MAG: porin family protein [Cellvibrio sp.]|uniref:porin family protein n=1 Tax=Cellvibrio sp. TaxID=1965322 RepID=UPI0027273CBF|nr:porin family protein [Cellvibrio sp.]
MRNWLAALALGLPMIAVAGDNSTGGFYLGGGAADLKMRFDEGGSLDWTTGEFVGGYKLNPFVGGEARLGYGSEDGMDLLYTSFYYRTESSNDTAKTYLLFGYTLGQIMLDGDPGEDDTVSLNGFSYGAGVGFPVTSQLNFNLEYRMVLDGKWKFEGDSENLELSGVSINVDYRF